MAVREYADKINYKHMTIKTKQETQSHHLMSPPAKIIHGYTCLLFQIQSVLLPRSSTHIDTVQAKQKSKGYKSGQTEEEAIYYIDAGQNEDVQVELSYLIVPNETKAQTRSQMLLYHFVHKWWILHLGLKAVDWLEKNENHAMDVATIEYFLTWSKGLDYRKWHHKAVYFSGGFPRSGKPMPMMDWSSGICPIRQKAK